MPLAEMEILENESFDGHYLFARIPLTENLLKGGDPLKGLPPLYLNAGSLRNEHTTTKSFLCSTISNRQDEDSIIVNDIFTQKGYYIDTKMYHNRKKKEHTKSVRKKVLSASNAFKQLKNVHPLSIVYDVERIDPLLSSVRCFDSLFVHYHD